MNERRQWMKLLGLGSITTLLATVTSSAKASSQILNDNNSNIVLWQHGNSGQLESGWEGTKSDSKSSLQYIVDFNTRFQLYRTAEHCEIFIKDITNLYHPRSGSIWIHYTIPNPVFYRGNSVKMRKLFLNFNTNSSDIFITGIKIMDASKNITEYKDLKLYGDQNKLEFDVKDIPTIQYGVGISLRIKAINARETDYIRIEGLGGDFLI